MSDAYIRFEHRSVEQESVRAEIRSRVRQLEAAPDQVLHASYLGRKHPAADVENLALYNIDDTGAAFVNAARSGLRFELGPTSRRSPSGAEYAYGYRYALAPRDGGFEHWQEGRTLASWEWVELGPFSGSKKLEQVWIAVARAPARIAWPARSPDTPFLVRVTIRVPKGTTAVLGGLVKGIVDGIVCAFQAHTDRSTIADLAARVSKTVPASAQEVEDLLLDQRKAVLGAVPRLLHARGPGVIWAPSDELCVAGELLIDRSESTTWSIEGSILEAEPVDGPIATGQAGPAGQPVVLWGR